MNTIGTLTYEVTKHLAGLLSPLVGQCSHHIKNLVEFVNFLETVQSWHQLTCLSVFILFHSIHIPIHDTLLLLRPLFTEQVVRLFLFVLTSSYFLCDGVSYEQIAGVAMESPLSPVVANFYKEAFEQLALEHALLKSMVFKCYIDDTFVVWPHGQK